MDDGAHERTRCGPRRQFLRAAAGVAGATSVAGCLGRGDDSVRVLSAGSLARTFEEHVAPAFEAEAGVRLEGEYHGANAVMRMVEDRLKHPDVIVSADATLLRDRLYGTVTDWDVTFAANAVGIGYDERSPFGRQFEDGELWYELARSLDAGDLAIGDPDLDPLGYRAVQAFALAEAEHDQPGLQDELLELAYREPDEPQLLAGVETGTRSAAVVYRNMAVDRDLPFVVFPDAYSFADPELADHYATATYTTDDGYTATGRPVLYNATVHDDADAPAAGRELLQFLVDEPELLEDAGLTVRSSLPRGSGAVPPSIEI